MKTKGKSVTALVPLFVDRNPSISMRSGMITISMHDGVGGETVITRRVAAWLARVLTRALDADEPAVAPST